MSNAAPIDFGTIEKSAESTRYVYFELFDVIAQFWEPGRQYVESSIVRPSSPKGFAYRATQAGQSQSREPNWPTQLSGTKADGGVIWAAIEAGANGVNEISDPEASVIGGGDLDASDAVAVDGTATNSRIRVTLSAGTAGETYTVALEFTSGGQTLVAQLEVVVV